MTFIAKRSVRRVRYWELIKGRKREDLPQKVGTTLAKYGNYFSSSIRGSTKNCVLTRKQTVPSYY